MSLKIKSSTPSRSLKRISLTQNGKVKNSPIKEMNGLSLKELVKNDEKLDSKLKTDLQQITMIMEEQRSQNYSNEKMDEEVYCLYLKKKVNRKKMKKLLEVLLLKKIYIEEKSMNELCELLRKHRPDLMRPRILNLILGIIHVIFNKTAITLFLLMTGVIGFYTFGQLKETIPDLANDIFNKSLENASIQLLKKGQKLSPNDIAFYRGFANSYASNFIKGASIVEGAKQAFYGTTIYNILRQASYFMPKGFRLGNRIRARHSARKLIGDTRKNKIS